MPLIENARLLFTSSIPVYPGMRSLSAPQSKGGYLGKMKSIFLNEEKVY